MSLKARSKTSELEAAALLAEARLYALHDTGSGLEDRRLELAGVLALLGRQRLARYQHGGDVPHLDLALPAGFRGFERVGVVVFANTAGFRYPALRLSTDGGATFRQGAGDYEWAAQILSTAAGTHDTHRTGFNVTNGTAGWFCVGQRAGHPSCLDLTLQHPTDSGRQTAWHYGLPQHHTSGSGRGGFGGGHYLVAEAHDAVQLRAVGTAAEIVAFDLTLYGIR